MINKQYNIINSVIFAAATSLNAFWILIVLKGAYPKVSAFMNFHPPTGPLLGLYISSILIFGLCFLAGNPRTQRAEQSPYDGWFLFQGKDRTLASLNWYFIGSVILYVFITLPVFHEPIIHLLK